jgi:hypothetical protein
METPVTPASRDLVSSLNDRQFHHAIGSRVQRLFHLYPAAPPCNMTRLRNRLFQHFALTVAAQPPLQSRSSRTPMQAT